MKVVLRMRWLVLLLFPLAGALALAANSGTESFYYLGCALLSCAYLLDKLDRLDSRTAAVWLVIIVFLVFYFLRFPILLADPASVIATHPDSVAPLFSHNNENGLIKALQLSSFVFGAFCIAAGLQLRHGYRPAIAIAREPSDAQYLMKLAIAISLLMVALGYVAYVYQIGRMGVAPGEPLPFRLKGIIFYARHVMLPLLILVLIYRANMIKDRRAIVIGLLLLATHGVTDMLLRGSRSSLLLCFMIIVFLSVSGGLQLRRRAVALGGGLLAVAILLMPIITRYRELRLQVGEGGWALVVEAFRITNSHLDTLIAKSFATLYFRIPGIETIWAIGSLVEEPIGRQLLDLLREPFGVTGYLNFFVYGVPMETYTLFAPGFVGWLYLVGGWIGMALGAIVWAVLCVQLPRILYSGGLNLPAVANTFLLWVLFISLTDGTLDSNFMLIGAGLVTLAAFEISTHLNRRFTRT